MHPTEPDMTVGQSLLATFPGLAVTNELRSEDRIFWATHLPDGAGPISLETFITSLLGGVLTDDRRRNVTVALRHEPTGIRVRVGGNVQLDPRDQRPFSLNQTYIIESGVLTIHLETVVAPFHGRVFIRSSLLAHARRFGVRRLTLSASSIGGSQEGVFVWARYGFVPTAEDWTAMRRSGLEKLRDNPALLPGDRDAVREILLDPVPLALRRLVYRSWVTTDREALKGFLDRMLSSNVSWTGELDLADAASLAWIHVYADGARPETFVPLLPAPSGQSVAPPGLEPEPETDSDEEASLMGMSEEEAVAMLVASINSQDGTMEEVRRTYPRLADRVQAALDRQKT